MKKFALAGNPNSGKTTLFNYLTGSTAHVGNWPGVTVDKKEGVYKKCPEPVNIIDLPGIYSLSPYTPEEVISRNYILDEKPDCVINIVDATNLERNLYLTTQLMEIDVPVVIALNMIDAVEKAGDAIDAAVLEKKTGLPVVKISALKGTGLDELMKRAYAASLKPRKAFTVLEEEFKKTFKDDVFGNDFEAVVADGRYKYISANYSSALRRGSAKSKDKLTKSDRADRVLTHKVWGIPIFLVILFAVFHLTFSENFLYIGAALPEGWVSLEGTAFEGVFGADGINSPGVILFNLLDLATSSISDAVAGAMEAGNVAQWAQGLVVDGMLGGLFAILSFLPQILLLFLFFSILEDSGYMARVAFILDRIFRKFGLTGRAFMPMIMGFGCSVPAMINTRTLSDENERIATIRVIPFFITYGMYVLGITVAIVTVILMRSTTMRGEVPPFIMELPAYHAPQFRNLMLHLWDKVKHFVKKAFTIILASTIVIWFISHFSWGWQYLSDDKINSSILAGLGQLIQPLFTPLGFGSQLGAWGWVFVVAAITGLIAKENVIATFGTLAACITSGFVADEALGGVRSI